MSTPSLERTPARRAVSSRNHPPHTRTISAEDRGTTSCEPAASWKRFLDTACVLLSLPVVLPLMLALVLWIKLVSHGPVIYRQKRIGRNGRPFVLYKFRSMHWNAAPERHLRHFGNLVSTNRPMVKLDLLCDPRLIPGGCLMRATGLDELPQLLNILRGEMSLVGPRPCLPEELRFFTRRQRVRFQALPGLTGIWQTQGKTLATFTEMNAMDARYVRDSSPLLDLAIILRTPFAIISQIHLARRGSGKDLAGANREVPQPVDGTLTAFITSGPG